MVVRITVDTVEWFNLATARDSLIVAERDQKQISTEWRYGALHQMTGDFPLRKYRSSFPDCEPSKHRLIEKSFVYIVNSSLMHFQLTFMVPSTHKGEAHVSPGTINIHTIFENSILLYKQSHKNRWWEQARRWGLTGSPDMFQGRSERRISRPQLGHWRKSITRTRNRYPLIWLAGRWSLDLTVWFRGLESGVRGYVRSMVRGDHGRS